MLGSQPRSPGHTDHLHYISLIHKSMDLLQEREEFIITQLKHCHKQKAEHNFHYLKTEGNEDLFPRPARTVQETKTKVPQQFEAAPVRYNKDTLLEEELDNFSGKIEGDPPADPVRYNKDKLLEEELDNFNGKIEGEEDFLAGDAVTTPEETKEEAGDVMGAVKEENETEAVPKVTKEKELDNFTKKIAGDKNILAGEAVTTPEETKEEAGDVMGAVKEEKETEGSLDWKVGGSEAVPALPAVDIGKIKSILSDTDHEE